MKFINFNSYAVLLMTFFSLNAFANHQGLPHSGMGKHDTQPVQSSKSKDGSYNTYHATEKNGVQKITERTFDQDGKLQIKTVRKLDRNGNFTKYTKIGKQTMGHQQTDKPGELRDTFLNDHQALSAKQKPVLKSRH
jgi:hypothetical protein